MRYHSYRDLYPEFCTQESTSESVRPDADDNAVMTSTEDVDVSETQANKKGIFSALLGILLIAVIMGVLNR